MKHARAILRRVYSMQRGQTLVIFSLLLVVLLGFIAMVTDSGITYWNRRILQNAVDGAALAGARELVTNNSAGAMSVAAQYAADNGVVTSGSGDELISTAQNPTFGTRVTTTYNPNDTVVVSAQRRIGFGLRYILGSGDIDVRVTAAAIVAPTLNPQDIWPWAINIVDATNPQQSCPTGCILHLCSASCPAPTIGQGNFGDVDFAAGGQNCGGAGGATYRQNILYGYNGPVPLPPGGSPPPWNWQICSQTGQSAGPTFQPVTQLFQWDTQQMCDGGQKCSYIYKSPAAATTDSGVTNWGTVFPGGVCEPDTACARVGIVPLVQSWPASPSGNTVLTVVDFGCFYLQDYNNTKNDCSPNGCNTLPAQTVEGVFLKECNVSSSGNGGPGGYGNPNTGPVAVFLWR